MVPSVPRSASRARPSSPGHWYRKTPSPSPPPPCALALFRAVNYALGGLCFVLLLAVFPRRPVAALVAPIRCAVLVDPGRPPPPAASPRTSPARDPGSGVSATSADDDEAAPAPAAALPQFVRPGRPVGPEAEPELPLLPPSATPEGGKGGEVPAATTVRRRRH